MAAWCASRGSDMTDLLLHNLRTLGTHHCDASVGIEAADEIERLRAELDAFRASSDIRGANLRRFAELQRDYEDMMRIRSADSAYAHRLATMLECALLNRTGSWNEGHALLDEYRKALQGSAPEKST